MVERMKSLSEFIVDADKKPYRGEIYEWKKIDVSHLFPGEGLGYKIIGRPVGHPTIKNWILTSVVVAELPEGVVETENSRYTLVPPMTRTPTP